MRRKLGSVATPTSETHEKKEKNNVIEIRMRDLTPKGRGVAQGATRTIRTGH